MYLFQPTACSVTLDKLLTLSEPANSHVDRNRKQSAGVALRIYKEGKFGWVNVNCG